MLHRKFQEAFSEYGTSDGAVKAWLTRKGGTASSHADPDQAALDNINSVLRKSSIVTGAPDDVRKGLRDRRRELTSKIADKSKPKAPAVSKSYAKAKVNALTNILQKSQITTHLDPVKVKKMRSERRELKKVLSHEATQVPAKDGGWGKCFYTTWMMPFKTKTAVIGSQESSDVTQAPPKSDAPAPDVAGFDAVQQLLNQNPEINGATLLNLMKSKGFLVVAPKEGPKEADSASANTPALRAKESGTKLSSLCNFRESSYRDDGIGATRYRVKLIAEGLGNFANAFYYPKEALANAAALFEGKKCYANHPSLMDEKNRPERDVREIIGHFENVAFEEDAEGRGMLVADCCLMPDREYEWARGLFRETVEYSKKYPDKDLVGLSINANGDASEVTLDEFLKGSRVPNSAQLKLVQAKEQGINRIRVVSRITDAMSCDLVTEAGAGGKIVKLLN